MNIIIVGCGKVGRTLITELNEGENNITVVDTDAEKVAALSSRYDVMGVCGNGATHAIQEEAGIRNADLLIAVTGSDELNLLCCLIAKKVGPDCQTIARVKKPEYSSEIPYLKDELGLAMIINPDQAAAAEIARILRFPSAIQIDTFAKGKVELLKFRLPEGSRLLGLTVRDLVAKLHCDILVCTVERGDEAFIAKADTVFAEKDVISIVASPENAMDFIRKAGFRTHAVKDAIVIGGGEIAHYLCEQLQHAGISLKIIEKKREVCKELCTKLPFVTVIHGDAAERELLLEEGLEGAGALVALTNVDEENIVLSLFAKSRSAGKQIAKINRIDFDDVIKQLDLDSIICPKNITADMILRYVRATKNAQGSNMETLYNVIPDKIEAAEFTVTDSCALTEAPLFALRLKPNVLIASILRNGKVMIPRGGDTIQPGDKVVIVSEMMPLGDITDILR